MPLFRRKKALRKNFLSHSFICTQSWLSFFLSFKKFVPKNKRDSIVSIVYIYNVWWQCCWVINRRDLCCTPVCCPQRRWFIALYLNREIISGHILESRSIAWVSLICLIVVVVFFKLNLCFIRSSVAVLMIDMDDAVGCRCFIEFFVWMKSVLVCKAGCNWFVFLESVFVCEVGCSCSS